MGLFSKKSESEKPAEGGLLNRWKQKWSAATAGLSRELGDLLLGERAIGPELTEEMEGLLLQADVGIAATQAILDKIAQRIERDRLHDARAVYQALREVLREMLTPLAVPLRIDGTKPFAILAVGVNGAGKTTTVGKLSHRFHGEGRRVLLAAGDTFRAAAGEQLQTWAERTGAELIMQNTGADAAAVAHDAMQAGIARGADVVIVDTAGRLHTQAGLMDELRKIKRVIAKVRSDAPHEVLLVLDGGNGQNAVSQLKHFHEAVGVSGLCVTKLDGTAKGGALLAIAHTAAGVPIRFVGLGEQSDDLRPFFADDFIDALLPPRG